MIIRSGGGKTAAEREDKWMNGIVDLALFALPALVVLFGIMALGGIVELIDRVVHKENFLENDIGYIEIEPDPFGNNGLVTKIHWRR